MLRELGLPLLPLLVACAHSGPPRDLGGLAADRVALTEAPSLEYVATALEPGSVEVVGDLFTADLAFTRAPDPSALLTATQAKNAERTNDGPALSVLTYNVGLLDATVFFVIPFAKTPYLKERRPALPDLILDTGHDVLVLQEVWRRKDVRRFERAAEAKGYLTYHGPRGRYNDGLLTLVRAELLADGTELEGGGAPYRERDGMEFFPGPHIKRGYTEVRFEHRELGPIGVFNTHTLAWPANWMIRMAEMRQIGLAIDAAADELGPESIVLLGGDLNGGSFYAEDDWPLPDGTVVPEWFANTISYGMALHYGELEDLWVLGQDAEGALGDVTLGSSLPGDAQSRVEVPAGDPTWCDAHQGQVFTAVDCTVLYFQQYGGEEYPARMDHLMVRDPAGRVWVEEAAIVFDERHVFGEAEAMEPSDHLGVSHHLRVVPAK